MQLYEEHLKSFNVSLPFQRLLQEKIGSEEVVLTTKCQFSKLPINIPVRHSPISYVHCIFDLNSWLEHFKNMQNKVEPTGFACPGCRKYTNFKDYGVDYTFYHVLEQLKQFKIKNPFLQLNESQLIYQQSKNIYIVETKVANKLTSSFNHKIKVVPQRHQLPGSTPILGVSRRMKEINNGPQNEEQRRILDEISQTIVKLQQLLFSMLYKLYKKNQNFTFKVLQDRVSAKKQQFKQALNQSLKLISLGKKSLNEDYVFALKKIYSNNQIYSILIVYLIQYGIWYEYPLTFKGQPYVQLEQALYIKGEGNQTQNIIYVIGGQKAERFSQSNQCLQIAFPKNPFQNVDEGVQITQLPDFPLEGYNFMGTSYKGNLYVFYGQKQLRNNDNQIRAQLLNSQYVLKDVAYNRRWEQMKNNLVERFDGSFFTITHQQFDKLIIFFGGVTKDPDGLTNYRCQQQHSGQIFVCKEEKFLGNVKQDFQIQFAGDEVYHKSVLGSPVFSCPYYGNNQLILSGECLKHKNTEQREIYTFDWANAVVKQNDLFSLEPPELILTPYRRRTVQYEIFSPVQDPQGGISYGFFYVIHQYEVEQSYNDKQPKILTQLLKINLTNGLFFTIPYQDSQTSRQLALQNLEKLADRPNQYL
ncbi:unnamed protein product (macronuclear) [Paramecium tetraurelia]|uniref:Uncharacterized protein n=1 Tax=Paramecium tetraurelia TaxID=5888 RepID=A0DTH9_PARTE|nr:uncharacterized protein GSPATT00020027001 [Paramecium tetraurelia]CAK86346.1 unnamed protein product [Paramecium tetraurelia]|eukprot:XP_001453743.1 hypothetical protein (macronuclear) [Paramecium tetraurelia strain d4-2]